MPADTCMRWALALSLMCSATVAQAATVWVGRFPAGASGLPEPWRVQQLDARVAPTRYTLKTWNGVVAIEAVAERSMALLGRPLEVDLEATPHLCWLWRVDAPLVTADMRTKAGDDYAARVYVSFKVAPEALGLGTRAKLALARSIYGDQVPDAALNYVWDNRQPVGTLMPNAYTDRTRMIVLRSGAGDAGAWVVERRDVAEDFKRAGAAILMVSSELPELLQVADRILVMRQGRITGELPGRTTQEEIMSLAALEHSSGRTEENSR